MRWLAKASLALFAASVVVKHRDEGVGDLVRDDQNQSVEDTMSNDTDVHRLGFLLWADGRSATKSLFDTLQASLDMRFCNGRKEPFICIPGDDQHPLSSECPTSSRLKECIKPDGNIYGAHIKPIHLNRGTEPDHFKNPWELMGSAARKVGIDLVVSILRENFLARMVSDYELTFTKLGRHAEVTKGSPEWLAQSDKFFFKKPLKQGLMENFKTYKSGVKAARAKNITVLEFTFAEVTTDMCSVVEQIAAAMCELGWAAHVERPQMLEHPSCQVFTGHTEVSNHTQDLAGRIGEATATKVIKELTGSKFEWMLDLEAIEPPPDTPLLRGIVLKVGHTTQE